ncbi:DUF58 domain-containing protein [bacterium]|nr:DUF58 domain-containing protein [bacterium]
MPIPELLEDSADVRRLEIMTRRIVNNVMAGEYHSAFKGQGMEFNEVKEYSPGDDVRTIDWNVTARTGEPFVKRYIEQRELTVIFAVDISGSQLFGSRKRRKRSLAAIITAVLAFSAIRNNDRVGLMLFSDKVECYVPPKKGRKHALRVVRDLIRTPESRGTDITLALQTLNKLQRRKSIVFLLSDFQQPDIRRALSVTRSRHDLIAISITDPREIEIPSVGLLTLEDAETGEHHVIDTSSRRVREELQARLKARREEAKRLLSSLKIDHIELRTDQDFASPIISFFTTRIRRKGG